MEAQHYNCLSCMKPSQWDKFEPCEIGFICPECGDINTQLDPVERETG